MMYTTSRPAPRLTVEAPIAAGEGGGFAAALFLSVAVYRERTLGGRFQDRVKHSKIAVARLNGDIN